VALLVGPHHDQSLHEYSVFVVLGLVTADRLYCATAGLYSKVLQILLDSGNELHREPRMAVEFSIDCRVFFRQMET